MGRLKLKKNEFINLKNKCQLNKSATLAQPHCHNESKGLELGVSSMATLVAILSSVVNRNKFTEFGATKVYGLVQ